MKIYIIYFLLGVSLVSCTEDYTYYPSVKIYYKLHTDHKKWADAKLACENESAKLAMPRNRKEMIQLTEIIKGSNANFILLGFHDIFQEGEYITVDGHPIEDYYHTWSTGEPNNQHKGNEDCGSMHITDLGLNDYSCEVARPFICQKSAPDKNEPQADSMCLTNNIAQVGTNPNSSSSCGPNSQSTETDGEVICSCLPGYIGAPPMCKLECAKTSECPLNKFCNNQKCIDPCPGACGIEALCDVMNHYPICSCPPKYTGDPFVRCRLILETSSSVLVSPCQPSPCGQNSQCKVIGDTPSCSCLKGFAGSPPECYLECVINSDCPNHLFCMNKKCVDPCAEACGVGAHCEVYNHRPICSCPPGYTGNPFMECHMIPEMLTTPVNHCQPSPCGPNSQCRIVSGRPLCSCLPEFVGLPPNCYLECVLNADCPNYLSCINKKCKDSCSGTCGENAECQVVNHNPICSCPSKYIGDPFVRCRFIPETSSVLVSACQPSPCGPNSQCRVSGDTPSCSCLSGFAGSPPECYLECVINPDCPNNLFCMNKKCVNPCAKACGVGARCEVYNHRPICSCPTGYTGDPFIECQMIPEMLTMPVNPCQPSPCGANSQCKVVRDTPLCSCLPEFVGLPPNCRPECISNNECSSHLSCINYKCKDPCPGSCGVNAECRVVNYTPVCMCPIGSEGDPFTRCYPLKSKLMRKKRSIICIPSQCGANAVCRNQNGVASCSCLSGYTGNPHKECRAKCVLDSECPMNRACIGNKCQDPCLGVCGPNSDCQVINHLPSCSCKPGFIGNPCTKVYPECYKYAGKLNKCYKLHLNAKKWSDARSLCQAEGGHLAIITSKEEEDFLVNMINKPSNGRHKDYAFVGAHDMFIEGSFVNVLNQKLDSTPYVRWKAGQPNGGTKENCLAMDNSGSLNDVSCEEPAIFFCQQQSLDIGLDIRMNQGQ